MRQEQTEKQLIEQIQRISIPSPDAEFEHALRVKFIKHASRKHRSSRILKRLSWIGGFAIVAVLGFLLVNDDLLPQQQKFAGEINANDGELQQDVASLQVIEDTRSVPTEIILSMEGKKVPIVEAQLIEMYNYVSGEPSGKWRFYQNQDSNQIYISRDQKEAIPLYQVDEGYVTAHLYPIPNTVDQYLMIMIAGKDGGLTQYHYFHMNEKGYLTEIGGIPQTGYSDTTMIWSPNGKKALVKLENSSMKSVMIGVIDPNLSFTKLYGEIDSEATIDWMATVGAQSVSFAIWLSDESILLFNNELKMFLQIEIGSGETDSFFVTEPNITSSNTLGLYSIGQKQKAIMKIGNIRYDVGFEPSHRLYLVDMKEELTEAIKPDEKFAGLPYMQYYLGVNKKGNQTILDIYQGENYQLSLLLLNPEGEEVVWQYDHTFPRVIANPEAVFSPDHKKLAIKLYSEEANTDENDTTYYQASPYYYLFLDLENQKAVDMELDEYELPTWLDDNTVKIGERTISLTKLFPK